MLPPSEAVGAELRQLRENSSLTISQLAKAVGKSAGYISEAERGLKPLSEDFLKRCEQEFGLDDGALSLIASGAGDPGTISPLLSSALELRPTKPRTTSPKAKVADGRRIETWEEVKAQITSMLMSAGPRHSGERIVLATLRSGEPSFGRHLPPWLAETMAHRTITFALRMLPMTSGRCSAR